jgi:hypothetical protein
MINQHKIYQIRSRTIYLYHNSHSYGQMPHLRSIEGVVALKRYVDNWPSVLMVYSGIKRSTIVKFKDGMAIKLRKQYPFDFYGEIYQKYLEDNGFVCLQQEDGKIIVQSPKGYRIKVLSKVNLHVIDEIFLMQSYGKPKLSDRPVIDVGCSYCDSAIYFVSCDAIHVYGYDPNMERYKLGLENIAINNLNNKITLYNEVATADKINALIKEKDLHDVFMKIDCEGCEYELIKGLSLSQITEIALEYHHEAKPLSDLLKANGFKVKTRKEIIVASRNSNTAHQAGRNI